MTDVKPEDHFPLFLDAVSKNGEKTRRVMYVLIIIVVFLISAIRMHNFPAWITAQYSISLEAEKCAWQNSRNPPPATYDKSKCDKILEQVGSLLNFEVLTDDDKKKRLTERINTLARRRTETQVFPLPFFGGQVHGNDLWVVSGILSVAILAVLLAHLRRELQSFRIAASYAKIPENAQLLLMTQIFASPRYADSYSFSYFLRTALFIFMYYLPFVIHLSIIGSDIFQESSFARSNLMIGEGLTAIEMSLKVLSLVIIFYLGSQCVAAGIAIDRIVDKLSRKFPDSNSQS